MSVQFGIWNFDGHPSSSDYLAKVEATLAPYGPDSRCEYSERGIDIRYFQFHITKESRREIQPHLIPSGGVLVWDGRLDNRGEHFGRMRNLLSSDATDVDIVAAAYEQWGTESLGMLVGDWALSLWNPHDRTLLLAKDFLGSRHVYYTLDDKQVTWCTILDPLVLFAGKSIELEEEYLAGWLSLFSAAHLTPYVGIHSVPPSSYVVLKPGKSTVKKYWEFDPGKRIRYRSDTEYEEHFRMVFGESVRRRLRSDSPVLAELSGGMDSSSIVCVADDLIAQRRAGTPRLDTLSYYDDSEPNWNERPYFTKVEERRGRAGCHIEASRQRELSLEYSMDRFPATPAAPRNTITAARLAASLISMGNRTLLSGTGGDEVTGGVSRPISELADLLATARLTTLSRQLTAWALSKRTPWFHLLAETLRCFLPPTLLPLPKDERPASWLEPRFVRSHRPALRGYERRLRFLDGLPSFQESLSTLDALRRQLACSVLSLKPTYEKSYPYLDRDLLEFLFAIPRAQLLRPGQRRSLVRRALAGIVPDPILNRRRKAFVARTPMLTIAEEWPNLGETPSDLFLDRLGIINLEIFSGTLRQLRNGHDIPLVPLMRAFALECWLKELSVVFPDALGRRRDVE
jgi:asparagine synthase (glutamine-hydrolysing)